MMEAELVLLRELADQLQSCAISLRIIAIAVSVLVLWQMYETLRRK